MVKQPFGFIVAANDYANLLLGTFLLLGATGLVPGIDAYQSLAENANLWIWPGLIIGGSIASRWGWHKRNDTVVEWAAMLSAISWLFAFLLYLQLGSVAAGLPLVFRPLAIAIYTRIKVTLDNAWHSK
jgi:hypothetical protein